MATRAKAVLNYKRLTFVRDRIEPLQLNDVFRIETLGGAYEMTKSDFYKTFPGVVESRSYRGGGIYSYTKIPRKAERFRIGAAPDITPKPNPREEYPLPDELSGECTDTAYREWLHREAEAHVRRDQRRWKTPLGIPSYEKAIHTAVCRTTKYDFYTGEILDWRLISKYLNTAAKTTGSEYKKELALLPTVDHAGDTPGNMNFQICSWRTSRAKSDLTVKEFVELCHAVVHLYNRTQAGVMLITLDPPQVDEFKRRLLVSRAATITIHYTDGRSENKHWNASRFDSYSDVIGNLRSRTEFRRDERRRLGIERIHVRICNSPQTPLGF